MRRSDKRPHINGRRLLLTLVILFGLPGAVYFWYYHRPQPANETRNLFEGVTYRRESRKSPRPIVLHLATVDLHAPGLRFVTTAAKTDDELPFKGQLTTGFLKENKLSLAVNGDFFHPWQSDNFWDYYPHIGDPVDVNGVAASEGKVYSSPKDISVRATLYLSEDNHASLTRPKKIYTAIGGHRLLRAGKYKWWETPALHPRTAVGIDKTGRYLYILIVDGRQPNYSEGLTPKETADLLMEFGAWDGVNLDGGGSTTMVIAGKDGEPVILNSPIDQHIPGRERPVANHFGLQARPLEGKPGVPQP